MKVLKSSDKNIQGGIRFSLYRKKFRLCFRGKFFNDIRNSGFEKDRKESIIKKVFGKMYYSRT